MATLGHGRLVSMMFDDVDLDVTCCSASAATNTVSGGSTSQVYNRHIAATNNGHEADVRKQAMAAAAKLSVHRQASSSAKNCIAILPVSSPWAERVVHDIAPIRTNGSSRSSVAQRPAERMHSEVQRLDCPPIPGIHSGRYAVAQRQAALSPDGTRTHDARS